MERFGQKGLTGPGIRPNPEGSMVNIGLLVLDQTAWARVATDPIAFADEHTLTLGVEPDFLHAAGQQTVACRRTGGDQPLDQVPRRGSVASDHYRDLWLHSTSGR